MPASKEDLIAIVHQSPEAVAIHDKSAWMGIFADNHVVEDPVGSVPHLSNSGSAEPHDALSRFYDTFIAPNTLAFDITHDVACGTHVMRDLTINLSMSDKVDASVPMHLLYELSEEGGTYKVARLAAHWEFMPMIMQLLKKGFVALPVLGALTWRMLKLQGLSGALGFSKAAFNVGKGGKQQVLAFERAVANKDSSALNRLFVNESDSVHYPYSEAPLSPAAFFQQCEDSLHFSKLLVAGDCVSASVVIQPADEKSSKSGIVIFKFCKKTLCINELFFYFDA
jgi:hypothetical protein